MSQNLSPELGWLAAVCGFTAVLWVPYIINRIRENGAGPALRNPNHDERPRAQWADRLMWAHANAVENLVVFAPLAIAIHVAGLSNSLTAGAVAVYFFARVAHAAIYTAGIPVLRTFAFAAGFGAQAVLVLTLLRVLGTGE